MEQNEQVLEPNQAEVLTPESNIIFLKYHPGKRECSRSVEYSGGNHATIVIGIPPNADQPLRLAFASSGGEVTHTQLTPFAAPRGYQEVKAYLRSSDQTKKQRILEVIYFPQTDVEEMERNNIPYTDPRFIRPAIFDLVSKSLGASGWEWVEYPLRALAMQAAARVRRLKPGAYYQREGD